MEIKPGIRVLELLKKFPVLFRSARGVYRATRTLPKELVRCLVRPTRTFGLSRGFYSGAEQVRTGAREGKIIRDGQPCPRFEEGSLVRLSGLNQDGNQPWPIFWLHEKNACLSGESLCLRDERGRLMEESTISAPEIRREDPAWWTFASRPRLHLPGNVTSIVSRWSTRNYWHWPMDAVSRLALLPEFPPDTKILVPPLRPWMSWFLREMGLEGRWIETIAPAVLVENYYFAGPSSVTGCHNPFAIRFLREKFLPKRSFIGDKPKRFYILREGLTRGVHNEDEVRAFFRRRGWALVAPETLPIPEQIELFAGA
jgi:hypothetical protein